MACARVKIHLLKLSSTFISALARLIRRPDGRRDIWQTGPLHQSRVSDFVFRFKRGEINQIRHYQGGCLSPLYISYADGCAFLTGVCVVKRLFDAGLH